MPALAGKTLDYHSTDLGAISPDETLIWSGQTDRNCRGCAPAAKTILLMFVVLPIVLIAIWALAPAQVAGVATALTLAIVGGTIALMMIDVIRRRSFTPKQVRFTDRRLIVTSGKPGDFRQVSHDQLSAFKGVTSGEGTAELTVAGAFGPESIPDDLGEAEVESIALHIDEAAVRQRLLSQMALAGIEARAAKRQWRRAWQPVKIETLMISTASSQPPPPIIHAPELLAGESVLWSGRPVLRWRADLLSRLIAIGRSSGWILVAAGIATAVFFGWKEPNGGLITLGVVASLILVAQFMGHIWTPFFQRRRLRRTSYTLTTHRVIIAVQEWGGTQVSSTFFDDATDISLTLRPDGRGSVSIGSHRHLELVEHAAAVHTLALHAVAGWRESNSALAPAPPRAAKLARDGS